MLTFRALFLLTLIAFYARGQSPLFTLASGHPKAAGIDVVRAVAVTDCNGDRRPDAVIAGRGYQLFYSDAAGGSLALTATEVYPTLLFYSRGRYRPISTATACRTWLR